MSSDDSPEQLSKEKQPQPMSARRRSAKVRSWLKAHSKWIAAAAVVAVFAALGVFGALDALSIPRTEQGDCTKASAEPHGKIGLPGAGNGKLVTKL